MKNFNKWLNLILPMTALLCIVAVWAIASAVIGSEYILPSVSETVVAAFKLFADGEFYYALLTTFLRSLIAFAFSFLLAVILGFLTRRYVRLEKFVAPIISIVRALPTIAVVLLLLFWTNSKTAPVIVTTLVVFPTLYTNVKNAFGSVDAGLLEACKVFGVDKKTTLKKVIFPALMPQLLINVGAGISLNLKLMVAAEVLSATANSLGYMLNTSKVYFETATMIAIVCVCVLLGLIIETVFNALSKKVGKWQ